MAIESGEPSRRYSLALDESWTKPTEGNVAVKDPTRLDPGLRHVVAAVEARDWDQLRRLTGIRQCRRPPGCDKPGSRHDPCKDLHDEQELPLLFEFDWREMTIGVARDRLSKLSLLVAEDYFVDAFGKEEKPRYAGGAIAVSTENPAQLPVLERDEKPRSLRNQIATILNEAEFIVRMELPAGATAFNEGALDDIDLTPATRHCHDTDLDGCGVIVGIIDDGCAFAHPNVLRPGAAGGPPTTRVRYLWDQAHPSAANGWTHVGYGGAELTGTTIDDMIRKVANGAHADKGISREERVYAALDYPIPDLASHGTHVMDIAAGSGRGLLGTTGVAPEADIIFVQLPAAAIASGGSALSRAIAYGIHYIFKRAGKTPAVINISYGGYAGPHDGASLVEHTIDHELAAKKNRALVVAAGNGFEADCHAHGDLAAGTALASPLRWIVKPEDPTENVLEVWWSGKATLALTLIPPGAAALGPVPLPGAANAAPPPQSHFIVSAAGTTGRIDYKPYAASQSHMIRVTLNPTGAEGETTTPLEQPGTWGVQLRNVATQGSVTFDAWIERDTSGRPGGARRRQSHFHRDDAESTGTLASYASSKLGISVGAYNAGTQQTCRYTACGPTRDGHSKPDVLAPAEEDAAGRGILSASSCSAMPTRMNGTSAAAPVVAGMVALLLQRAKAMGCDLSAAEALALVRAGAQAGPARVPPLHANAHNAADATRPVKQDDPNVWNDLIGCGQVYWPTTVAPLCMPEA